MKERFYRVFLCLLLLGVILPQSMHAEEGETEPLTSLVGDGKLRVSLINETSYRRSDDIESHPFNGTLEDAFVAVSILKDDAKTNSFVFDKVTVTDALTLFEEAKASLTLKGENSVKKVVLDAKSELEITCEEEATLELIEAKATLGEGAKLVDWSGELRQMEKSSKLFALTKDSIGFNPDDLSFDVILEVTNEWQEELTYVWQVFENDKWTTIANQTTATYHTDKERLYRVLISCGESMMVSLLEVKIPDSYLKPLEGNKDLVVKITSDRTYKVVESDGENTLYFDGSLVDTFKVVRIEATVKGCEFIFRDVVIQENINTVAGSSSTLSFRGENKLPMINNAGDLTLTAEEDATLVIADATLDQGTFGRVTDYTGVLKTILRSSDRTFISGSTNVYNPAVKEHLLTVEAGTTLTDKKISYQWQLQGEKSWTNIKEANAKSYTASTKGNYRVLVGCLNDTLTSYYGVTMDEVELAPLVGVDYRDVILVRPYTYQYTDEVRENFFNGMLAGTFASVQVENTMVNAAYTLNGVTLRDSLSIEPSSEELTTCADLLIKGKNSIGELKVNGIMQLTGDEEAEITYKKIVVGKNGALTDYTGLLREVVVGKDTIGLKEADVMNYLSRDSCRLVVEPTSKEAEPKFTFVWQQKVGNEWKAIAKADANSLVVSSEGNYRVLVSKDNVVLSSYFTVVSNYMGYGASVTIVGDHAVADDVKTYSFNNELTGLFRTVTVAPQTPQDIELSFTGSVSVDLLQVKNSGFSTLVQLFDKASLKKVKVDSRLELSSDGFIPTIVTELVEMGDGVFFDYTGRVKKIVRGEEEFMPIEPEEDEQVLLVEGTADVSFAVSTNNPDVLKWVELQRYDEEKMEWISEDLNSMKPSTSNTLRAEEMVELSTRFTVRKRGFYRGMVHTTDDRIHFSTQPVEVAGDEVSIGLVDNDRIQLTVVDGRLSVRLNGAHNEPQLLSVFTLSGQMIVRQQLRDEATVALTSGNYIVAIGNKSYKIQVGR